MSGHVHSTPRFPFSGLLVALALSGCSLVPAYEAPEQSVPSQWEHAEAGSDAVAIDADWWRAYGHPELDALIGDAMSANHDLAAAVSRIEQGRASLNAARAALLPAAALSASTSRERREDVGQVGTSGSAQAAVSVDYETDLWGANRAGTSAADLRLSADYFNRDAVTLALQSDIATAYFQWLALHDRLSIAESNLQAARELLRLVQVRFDNGAATALDLAQQRTELFSIEVQIPGLRRSINETRHALAVLTARPAQTLTLEGQSLTELVTPAMDPGLPVELLMRRPDIRAAEANLLAANADVGAARAALLPGLSLSASAASLDLAVGGGATATSIGASLAQILFDGGRRTAQIDLTLAVRQELAENYAQTVLVALKEVEDALSALTTTESQAELLSRTVDEAQEAYRLARLRYDAGAIDLLTVLDSQRTLLNTEDSLVQARQSILNATAELVRALGGGWHGHSGV
jgi:outer membrane protein, multidrug efflux system